MNNRCCHCGCGGKTRVPERDAKGAGWIKGVPMKYIHGHNKPWKGKNFSKEHCDNLSKAHIGIQAGENNATWKGDKVGYSGLHHWLRREMGEKTDCVKCCSDYCVHIANKSGKYLRDISDYSWLCIKCHRKHDGWYEKMYKTRFGKEYAK